MKRAVRLHVSLILCLFCMVSAATENEYPGRNLYPEVPVMELVNLHEMKEKVLIVDVRSEYEYQTLRILGSINIPLFSTNFIERIRNLRSDSDYPIVFYCNGTTCLKSYKAVRKAKSAGIENSYAFDAGIFDWARANPKDAVLLGQNPMDPADLIDRKRFESHLLAPAKFEKKVLSGAIVLDARDPMQREGIGYFVGRERQVAFDDTKRLDRFIKKAKRNKKDLLIYDAVGKQVRWLQYYLEQKEVKNYYFLKGGATAYYNTLANRLKN